jgi:hypothetical protein
MKRRIILTIDPAIRAIRPRFRLFDRGSGIYIIESAIFIDYRAVFFMEQAVSVPSDGITTGNYVFLKGRFKSVSTNIYGLFLVVFNPQKQMESFNACASSFSNNYDMEPHLGWDLYEEKITENRWKGNCNPSMTNAIIGIFESINKEARLRGEFYTMISSYNYTQIETVLFDAFKRIIRDHGTVIETGIQESTLEEVVALREKRSKNQKPEAAPAKPEAAENHDFEVEEGASVVPVSMMLSPVRGKLLYELKIGDRIMLRFNPKTEVGLNYIKFFNLTTPNGKVKAVPGEVIDIRSDKKDLPIQVLSRIDERIYGISTEEERHVRVCLYDPKIDGSFKSPSRPAVTAQTTAAGQTGSGTGSYSSATYLLIGIIAFILVLVIALLYILL